MQMKPIWKGHILYESFKKQNYEDSNKVSVYWG